MVYFLKEWYYKGSMFTFENFIKKLKFSESATKFEEIPIQILDRFFLWTYLL